MKKSLKPLLPLFIIPFLILTCPLPSHAAEESPAQEKDIEILDFYKKVINVSIEDIKKRLLKGKPVHFVEDQEDGKREIKPEWITDALKKENGVDKIDIGNAVISGDLDFRIEIEKNLVNIDKAGIEEDVLKQLKDKGIKEAYLVLPTISIVNCKLIGSLKASHVIFMDGVSFKNTNFDAGAEFYKATFVGDANFNDATLKTRRDFGFENVIFNGNTSFNGATFNGTAYLSYATFNGNTSFNGATFNGTADLSDTTFNDNTNFRNTEFIGNAFFTSAIFNGRTNINGTFNGSAGFRSATFNGTALFRSAEFGRTTTFNGTTTFLDAIFNGDASFSSATFNAYALFNRAAFNEKTSFSFATFNGSISFAHTEFLDNVDFSNTLLGTRSSYVGKYLTKKDVIKIIARNIDKNIKEIERLEWILIRGKNWNKFFIKFPEEDLRKEITTQTKNLIKSYRAAINKEIKELRFPAKKEELLPDGDLQGGSELNTNFSNVIFYKFVDFRNVLFLGDTTFKEAVFKELGLFDGSFFFNAQNLGLVNENNEESLVSLNFDNSYFNLLKGLALSQVFPNLHKRIKYPGEEIELQTIREQSIASYKYFQENFRKTGDYDDADEIYYERKKLEAMDNKNSLGLKIRNWCLDKMCKYGTSPVRIVLVSFIFIGGFTILYFISYFSIIKKVLGTIEFEQTKERINPESINVPPKHTWYYHLWHSFYLSLNTFNTVGTGDIIATKRLRLFVLMEGALGWLMLGLFIVVLSSKYFR